MGQKVRRAAARVSARRPSLINVRPLADTIFTKIIAGEIPCHRVYKDDKVLAFLDIAPLSPGHTLVVPKEPAETLDKLSEESAATVGRVLPRVARAVLAATGATMYNVLHNNGEGAHKAVFQVHFHIIPKVDGRGLGVDWKPGSLEPRAGSELAEKLRTLIG